MPQWNTSSVRDAFSSYPLTADLCTTYPRQPPEKQSLVLMNSGEREFSCLCPFNLTRLESAQVFKVRVYIPYANSVSATSYAFIL